MFAVDLAAFVVCTTLFSVGVGLIILGVGLIILVAGLVVAGWSARMSRSLLAYAGHELPRGASTPRAGPGVRGKLRRLGHAQSWRDLLHVLVNFVLATFTFSMAVSWVAGGPGGVTYWFWSRWLPDDNEGLPDLLGFPGRFADITFNTVLGMILLLTTPMVLRGLVRLHVAVGPGPAGRRDLRPAAAGE